MEKRVIESFTIDKNTKAFPLGRVLLRRPYLKGSWVERCLPVEGDVVMPFLVTEIFSPQICYRSLLLGVLDSYSWDSEFIKKLNKQSGIDVEKQKEWYVEMFCNLNEKGENLDKALEYLILSTLYTFKKYRTGHEYMPFFRNATEFFPTSQVCYECMSKEADYLYHHPEEGTAEIYKRLQNVFKKINGAELDTRAWATCILMNYSVTGLLGEDVSKCKHVNQLTKERHKRVIKERDFHTLLYGDEFI
jgi:hypothetical protein